MKRILLSISLFIPFCIKPMGDVGKTLEKVGERLGLKDELTNMKEVATTLGLSLRTVQQRTKQYGGLAAVILVKRYRIAKNDETITVLRAALRGNKDEIKRGLLALKEKILGEKWKEILFEYKILSEKAFTKKYSRAIQNGVKMVLNVSSAVADILKKRPAMQYLKSVMTTGKEKQLEAMEQLNKAVGLE